MELVAGDYRLVLAPGCGGSIARFDWRGKPLFRPTKAGSSSVLEHACFPMVPFVNRIAHGRFSANGRAVHLKPNFPEHDHPHPLHGFGWISAWSVEQATSRQVRLCHAYSHGEWPWTYRAEQDFELSPQGLVHRMRVRNCCETPMPAGLGFHPYIPRDPGTRYVGLHTGAWRTAEGGLPQSLVTSTEPRDWWEERPVATDFIDTVFTGRFGDLRIEQPNLGLVLTISPSSNLPYTAVYNPEKEDFFCVEPSSHATDALNRPSETPGMVWVDRYNELEAHVRYHAEPSKGRG